MASHEFRLTALERSKQLSTVRRIFVRWPATDRGSARVTVNVGGVVSPSEESEITPDDATLSVVYHEGVMSDAYSR